MRALNQPRYIGDDEALVLILHDAEVGHERGERVVGDFGLGGGDSANQRAFARVGHPDDADISEQFQLQPQRAPFARQALLGEAGRLAGGSGEVRVAASAFAPARSDESHARARQVCQQVARVGVVDQRTDRHAQRDRLAVAPLAVAPTAVPAAAGLVASLVVEVEQGAEVRVRDQHDAAAVAAVAAIRSSARHMLLTAERDTPVPAASRLHLNHRLVDKHRGLYRL
jgi:hypothetical protein